MRTTLRPWSERFETGILICFFLSPAYLRVFRGLRSDTCSGRQDLDHESDSGLGCYRCHVQLSNEHLLPASQRRAVSREELIQLRDSDAMLQDVTVKSDSFLFFAPFLSFSCVSFMFVSQLASVDSVSLALLCLVARSLCMSQFSVCLLIQLASRMSSDPRPRARWRPCALPSRDRTPGSRR